jgi:hypothetical protein
MIKLMIILSIAVSTWDGRMAMAQGSPITKMAEFPGSWLKWIHIAEPEFQRRRLNLDNYTIAVVERRDFVEVMLTDSQAAGGVRGNLGSVPGFEVEIRKDNKTIVRANFVR